MKKAQSTGRRAQRQGAGDRGREQGAGSRGRGAESGERRAAERGAESGERRAQGAEWKLLAPLLGGVGGGFKIEDKRQKTKDKRQKTKVSSGCRAQSSRDGYWI